MANTPNYTIVSEPSYAGILAGASTALSGIAQEAKAAKKAQFAYNSFADQLEQEGLVGDAAIYRSMAANETPNYLNAALTGKAATRDLEMPFQQALKLLNDKRDRDASMQRAELARQGLSVTERQGLRMEDSILSQDVSIVNQELRDINRDRDRIRENMVRDRDNPALMELYVKQMQEVDAREKQARGKLDAIQQQRRGVARQMSPSSSTSPQSASISGSPDPGPLPTGDPSSPQIETSLLAPSEAPPFNPDGTQNSVTESPEVSFAKQRGRAFNTQYQQLKKKYAGNEEVLQMIENAEDISTLTKIDREQRGNISIYKSPEEAVNAAKPYAPDGHAVIPKPLANGKGFTFGFVKKSTPVRKVNERTWSNGQGDIWFLGEDNIIYHRMANEDPAQATMIQDKDGSAVTAAGLQSWFNDLGIAYEAGITSTPPPKEVNPTTKQNALNPNPTKVNMLNPNTPEANPDPVKNTMMNWQMWKSSGGNK